jgi:hypothetical protein
LVVIASLVGATDAVARGIELPSVHPHGARTIVVDAAHGADGNPGTSARPLRTVTAAWNRIPARTQLRRPVRIVVRSGRYGSAMLPNYWESRWGSRSAPVVIAAAHRGSVSFASVNLFDLRWVAFDGIDFRDRFDLFHCDSCRHVLLTHGRLVGKQSELHENVKVNQSRDIGIVGNRISGADDNAIDFVAVQYGLVRGNVIEHAGDWCAYAKGGSAFVTVAHNRIRHCGTGGFTAGQGTGFQFMTAPFLRYEAYGVTVIDNLISDTAGAGVGINGGYNVVIARNRMWNVGRRSHLVEVVYGLRSCDGRPGDASRQRCRQYLDAGGWGTTRVDDGTNAVRIPNRHVYILGNVIDNPVPHGDELFNIAAPYSGASQAGSGLGAVRADDDLHIADNVIAGRGTPSGLPADDARRNELRAHPGLFADPGAGDFTLTGGRAAPAPRLPVLRWADSGGVSP